MLEGSGFDSNYSMCVEAAYVVGSITIPPVDLTSFSPWDPINSKYLTVYKVTISMPGVESMWEKFKGITSGEPSDIVISNIVIAR